MTTDEIETLGILAESPLWQSLTPSEKRICLREAERRLDEKRHPALRAASGHERPSRVRRQMAVEGTCGTASRTRRKRTGRPTDAT